MLVRTKLALSISLTTIIIIGIKISFVSLMMIMIASIIGIIFFLTKHPAVGGKFRQQDIEYLKKSPNYDAAKSCFKNLEITEEFNNDENLADSLTATNASETSNKIKKPSRIKFFIKKNFFSKKITNKRPQDDFSMPTIKTNLQTLNPQDDLIIWLGHSSYYLQISGIKLLIDPILQSKISHVPFLMTAFKGTNLYAIDDFPEIDILLITHDHYDHLDYPTIKALQFKVKRVITTLGIGLYLQKWWDKSSLNKITELDWFDEIVHEKLQIVALPTRHFSGRSLQKNPTLWASFALITADKKLYFGADSGYGKHFALIGSKYGPFDFAALDSGQYDNAWKYIHMTPEESTKAAADLQTKYFMPQHVGRFALAFHPWDEPLTRAKKAAQKYDYQLLTPKIGQPINMNQLNQKDFAYWWENQ